MRRALFVLLVCCCAQLAQGQYPIYQAMPSMAYSPYGLGYSPYGFGGYGPFGLGGVPSAGVNWLPPTPPSPYYVVPSGREYLQNVRRQETATYSQLKLQYDLQKLGTAEHSIAR